MKPYRIITFVGTSMFDNYQRKTKPEFTEFTTLQREVAPFKEWYRKEQSRTVITRKVTGKSGFWRPENLCAEVKSILKITHKLKQSPEVHLVTSDTILSVLAATLIQQWFRERSYSVKIDFGLPDEKYYELKQQRHSRHIVSQLNFKKGNDYEQGLKNLQWLLQQEINYAKSQQQLLIFNITAGYKAITPYVVLLAQIHQIPLMYMYHDEKHLTANDPLVEYHL